MSVVVVVKKDNEIVIAADTLTTYARYIGINSTHKSNSSKIVKYKDSYIGSVGAAMAQNMFLYSLQSSKKELSLHGIDNIYSTMLKIHKVLRKDHYMAFKESGAVQSSQVTLLIANSSGIFGINEDRYVMDYSKFWANGSGSTYALGAMEQAYDTHTASEIAKIGVEAACEFDKYCELPMNIHTIKEDFAKEKTKVVEPIVDNKIYDNWCDNVSYFLKNISNYLENLYTKIKT